jgi:hypothetical protein
MFLIQLLKKLNLSLAARQLLIDPGVCGRLVSS